MVSLKVTPITPKRSDLPSSKAYQQAIKKAVEKTARLVQRDLQSTTKTWNHKVKFEVVVDESGGDYAIVAGTDDKIYGYVNDGTEPHIIRAKNGGFLYFRGGYQTKTRPGFIGSYAGGRGSGDWVKQRVVLHPGTKPRRFNELIQKRRQATAVQEISQAVAKIARKQS